MLENLVDNENLTIDKKGLVYLHNLIYIPECMRSEIIIKHHDNPIYRHIGTEKTAKVIL